MPKHIDVYLDKVLSGDSPLFFETEAPAFFRTCAQEAERGPEEWTMLGCVNFPSGAIAYAVLYGTPHELAAFEEIGAIATKSMSDGAARYFLASDLRPD